MCQSGSTLVRRRSDQSALFGGEASIALSGNGQKPVFDPQFLRQGIVELKSIPPIPMKTTLHITIGCIAFVTASCHTAETAATGTATTVGHAAQGIGRTARTAGTGVVKTVGDTANTAGEGIAERDLKKSTAGTVKTAGQGVGQTAVDTGSSHLKTTSGALKDTGKTVRDTAEAAEKE